MIIDWYLIGAGSVMFAASRSRRVITKVIIMLPFPALQFRYRAYARNISGVS